MMLTSINLPATDFICTYKEGECIVEFGDYGKAPNQYATEVGDLNVISSTIVTQVKDKILIIEPVKQPETNSEPKK